MKPSEIATALTTLRADLRAGANGLIPGDPPGDHRTDAPLTDLERLAAIVDAMLVEMRVRWR